MIILFRIRRPTPLLCNIRRRRIMAVIGHRSLRFTDLRSGHAFRAPSYMDQHNTPTAFSERIRGAPHTRRPTVHDMGVNRRRPLIAVAKGPLHPPNIGIWKSVV